jgi:hypothetical protein
MSGKTTKRAARAFGSMVMQPPIPRTDFAEIMGADISDAAWSQINTAFYHYGVALDDLGMSRSAKSKDPAKASWDTRQKATVKALEAALDRLAATRKHDEFLREASENYSVANNGHSFGTDNSADLMLKDAYQKILHALVIVERAEPADIEVPTIAHAQGRLVSDLRDALQSCGITVEKSNGWTLDGLDHQPSLADLTPFENLIDALLVHDWYKIAGFSKTIRKALKVDSKHET